MRDTYVEGATVVRRDGTCVGCLYDTLGGWTFGPSFDDRADADRFIDWLWDKYQVEPHNVDGVWLKRAFDEYYGRVIYLAQYERAMGQAVIVHGDTPSNVQVAVIREHWPFNPNALGAFEDLIDTPIEARDTVGVEYLCRGAEPSGFAKPSPASEPGETIYLVPAYLCTPVIAWGVLLNIRGMGLESYEVCDGVSALGPWQRDMNNSPYDPRLLVKGWEQKIVSEVNIRNRADYVDCITRLVEIAKAEAAGFAVSESAVNDQNVSNIANGEGLKDTDLAEWVGTVCAESRIESPTVNEGEGISSDPPPWEIDHPF